MLYDVIVCAVLCYVMLWCRDEWIFGSARIYYGFAYRFSNANQDRPNEVSSKQSRQIVHRGGKIIKSLFVIYRIQRRDFKAILNSLNIGIGIVPLSLRHSHIAFIPPGTTTTPTRFSDLSYKTHISELECGKLVSARKLEEIFTHTTEYTSP